MLKIINNLKPFFEDCYREISVREYARMMNISPPTASNILKNYEKQGLLNKREERRHLLFHTNNTSRNMIDLCRMYWRERLSELCSKLKKRLADPTVILFGSLAKAEAKKESDVDIAIFAPMKKSLDFNDKEAERDVSLFWFRSLKDVKNKHLLNNILNGYVLAGSLRWER